MSGTFPRQEILNHGGVEGLSWAQTGERVSKHAFMSLPLTVDVMCWGQILQALTSVTSCNDGL